MSAETLPLLRILAEFFAGRSATAHLVGGTLRDALLGRQSSDIDIAVIGDAISLGRELADVTGGSFVSLNETHATARVVLPERWSAGGESPARIHVDLTSCEEEITRDLARRDFTIDALALPLDNALAESPSDRLIDPLGGMADLAAATLRPASDRVFQDDPVRLLRGVRLAAQLGFSLDDSAVQLIQRDAHLLTTVAPERLRDELLKTLAEPGASLHLRLMDDLGLLCLLIPELEEARGVEQPREHYWNVFYHCVEAPGALEQVTDRDGIADNEILACVPWHASLDTYFDEEISDGHTRRTIPKAGKPPARHIQACHQDHRADGSHSIHRPRRPGRGGVRYGPSPPAHEQPRHSPGEHDGEAPPASHADEAGRRHAGHSGPSIATSGTWTAQP